MVLSTRFILFMATNFAILIVMALVMLLLSYFLGIPDFIRSGTFAGILAGALVYGMTGALVSLAISKWIALRETKAKIIVMPADADEAWLKSTLERLASRAGIGMPDVAIYESDDPNAFSTGMRRDHALVAVSSRLMKDMDRDQLQAVLGHEVAHIANGDMVTMTLLTGVLNAFVIFIGQYVIRGLLTSLERSGRSSVATTLGAILVTFLLQLCLGVLATAVVMAFCRHRELRADAGGAKLAGKTSMISALKRLGALEDQQPKQALPKALKAFGVHEPAGGWGAGWFLSHPPLEQRIMALEKMQAS